jgi:hypothetical protein
VVFVVVSIIVGLVVGLRRCPFFLLVPLAAVLAGGTLFIGIIHGVHPGVIGVEVIGSVAALQLAYLSVSLTTYLTRSAGLMPQIQAAIGVQLRNELEIPRSLPPRMAVLVGQLRYA